MKSSNQLETCLNVNIKTRTIIIKLDALVLNSYFTHLDIIKTERECKSQYLVRITQSKDNVFLTLVFLLARSPSRFSINFSASTRLTFGSLC